MIKNDRQYRSARSQAERLSDTLRTLQTPEDQQATSALREVQIRAARGELQTLQGEIAEYEALVSGRRAFLDLHSISELPHVLIKARIASGVSQAELAARLSLKEQQIQRYEATDYSGASIGRLAEIADALGIRLPAGLQLETFSSHLMRMRSRLEALGLDRTFIRRRLLPANGSDDIEGGLSFEELFDPIRRILGVSKGLLMGKDLVAIDPVPIALARFKLPARYSEPKTAIYALYAHYLATMLTTLVTSEPKTLSADWRVVREAISERGGAITLEAVLQFLWSSGSIVLPLSDPGGFHAAFWRIDGRNVIVLKQRTRAVTRWLFDLLHEYYHATREAKQGTRSVIDGGNPLSAYRENSEEREASMFAGEVLLGGRAEDLAGACVTEASGSVERLKAAVRSVATRERVSVGILANYLAYRLSLQDVNWWGTAANLQDEDGDPWLITRDFLLAHINTGTLKRSERGLLERALRE